MKYVKFTFVKLIVRTISVCCFVLLFYSLAYSVSKETPYITTTTANKSGIAFFEDNSSSKKSLDESQKTKELDQENKKALSTNEELAKTDSSGNVSNNKSSIRRGGNKVNVVGGYFLSLVMSEEEIRSLKNKFYVFGQYNIPAFAKRFYGRFVEFIFTHPLVMLLLTAILFFILNIVFVMIVLNCTIREKNRKDRCRKVYGKIYEDALLAYIFGEKDWGIVRARLKHIERKENKKILINILFNFQENLKGNVSKCIPEIYVNLDLHKDALKASKSMVFHRKVQAIKELTYLYPEGAVKIIPGYINDENDRIRAEVQTSYIRLNQKHPFQFFKYLTNPFALWTQLSAFNLIRLHQLPVPSFVGFLNSNQNTVRNFCLRMIIHFQQLEDVSVVFHLLDSEIEKTRFLTYQVINDLRLYDGKLNIKKKYRDETEKNKKQIIKALRNIGSSEDLDFLEIILKSETVSLKTEACRSMYYINEEGKSRIMRLAQEFDPELKLFISHITDQRN